MTLDAYGRRMTDAELVQLAQSSTGRVAQRRPGTEFLKGPVPLDWLRRAAGLRGSALAVGLALWFRHGIENGEWVKLTSTTLSKLGVDSRTTAYRALAALEGAGLVRVKRGVGRAPVVALLLPASEALLKVKTQDG